MSLFQNSVLNKYINELDGEKVEIAWEKFKTHFHNPDIQENIRNSKEEQYQGEFLIDLFVNVFGYIKNPTPNFNLTTELKNVKGAKKADGAILKNDEAIAVIELKGTDTIDLAKVETQAFGYKNNHPKCLYVVTSNFEKLRFYIENAVEFEEFNLFNLDRKRFDLLYLCLFADRLLDNIPKKIKDESISEGEIITKKLYRDYSNFRNEVFSDIVENNPHYDKLTLFRKTQKLLDRFLFILFAEDKSLLPPNFTETIIKGWKDLWDTHDEYFPLYVRFKKNFGYLNEGYKGGKHDIFAYNGGLFLPDEILDNIKIDDELLSKHTKILSNYDFASEVSVNILGHIFEHSLTEIESIQAELKGEEIDKSKTKRKKDGVFYTPTYITKYIVDNTIGKLCGSQKAALDINEEDYEKRKGRRQTTVEALRKKLDDYREWLLNLTICDPACGSGAFLNQALEFLIAEHRYIDELYTNLEGFSLPLTDLENAILENNLFGVDINEESVEIAKLSLWLRTAQKGRKLTTLNNNIKCGNSLIDNAEIAGEKAFVWKDEFPKVFANGGFDVVIGNPPYGAKLTSDIQKYLNDKYINGGSETVISFTKLSYDLLLKKHGKFGFIIPKSFTFSSNYEAIRNHLLKDISEIIDCKKVWKEVKLEQIMLFFSKNTITNNFQSGKLNKKDIQLVGNIDKKTFDKFGFYLNDISDVELEIALKIRNDCINLNDISKNSRGGIFQKLISEVGNTQVLGGAEIQRNDVVGIKGKIDREIIAEDKKCFIDENSILVQNIVAHIENPTDRIKITACYPITRNYAIVDTINQITFEKTHNSKTFWLLLNSKLLNWYCYRFIFAKAIRTMHFDNAVTKRIPIPKKINEESFVENADILLSLNEQLKQKNNNFLTYLQSQFPIEKFSQKLQNWHELEFADFINELGKAIKKTGTEKLTKSDEMEWMELFETKKIAAQAIKSEIDATDRKIDEMVYELYGLEKDEIAVVEKSLISD